MVMLTDLLERKEQLEEENARIERKLSILRQIDELAKQLEDPELPVEPVIPEPPPYEGDVASANGNGPAAATPETLPDAPPAPPPPPPKPPAPPATSEWQTPTRRQSSKGQRDRILQALVDLRGTALQIDLLKKSGLASPLVSAACRDLAEAGLIRAIGKGGYQNRSTKWQLTASTLPPAVTSRPISPRVRKAIEQEEKRAARKGRQPATHEGRILTQLVMRDTMTVPEMAAELGIPASTVGRLIGKLREEGEVVDKTGNGDWRRVMVG